MAQIQSMIGKDKVLSGVDRIVFVPWEQGEDGEWKKAAAGFALDSIVADTTSITQDEAETNAIDCETRDEPIIENITLGSYQFSCESASIAKEILKNCLGFTVVDGEDGNFAAYAPASYQERWAEVEVMFKNGYSMVLPKIKLSSNISGESLKTGIPRGIIKGTAYTTEVEGADGKTYETPLYMSNSAVNTIAKA